MQKATELGVTRIYPLECEYSERKDYSRQRCEKIIQEAARQSRRYYLPELMDPVKPDRVADTLAPDALILVLHNYEENSISAQLDIRALSEGSREVALIVGPQGGFSPAEVDYFRERVSTTRTSGTGPDWYMGRMGTHVLRLETAALAGLSWLLVAS